MKMFIVSLATVLLFTGCGSGDDTDSLAVQTPPSVQSVELVSQPATTSTTAEQKPFVPAGGTSVLPPELAPVQQGLEAFKAQHNRLPNNVEEMVEKKIIPSLPPLPVDKIYFIDHDSGRVMISSGP